MNEIATSRHSTKRRAPLREQHAPLHERRTRLRERRADACALAFIVLCFVAFFAHTLITGKFLVAGDAYFYSYPLRSVEWDMIRRGTLPLWTPHVLAGYPLLSMSQLALGYPPTWAHLLLPHHLAEEIYVLLPFLVAPAFTYAYARETGRSRTASLLAALAFTYGGMMTSRLGVTGLRTNGVMWLPLLLVALERARRSRFAACLLPATAAYTMSVLNGDGQCFVYVGLVAALYALIDPVRALVNARREGLRSHVNALREGTSSQVNVRGEGIGALRSWETWRPLAVALGAIMLGACVAAYQILETLRAARRSVRAAIGYGVFSDGSFSLSEVLRSCAAPPYHLIEVTTYVAPLALVLAFVGSCVAWRRRDARGIFWIVVACLSFLLMLGAATPLNWFVYHLPVLNRFRYPSRHAFEWTFSIAMLAALGFDALAAALARAQPDDANDVRANNARAAASDGVRPVALPSHKSRADALLSHEPRADTLASRVVRAFMLRLRAHGLVIGWLLVAACALTGWLWWRDAMRRAPQPLTGLDMGLIPAQPETIYLIWKLAFTLLVALAVLVALASRGRGVLLACAIGLACLVEPFILCSYIWFPFARRGAEFAEVAPAIKLLQSSPPEQHRVYTRVNLFVFGYARRPPLDLPNVTAVRGLHNVAGYEQFVQERFSRALGNAGVDAVNPRYDVKGSPDATLFAPRSRVLDLLNTSFVVTFANLSTAYEPTANDGEASKGDGKLPPTLDASRWRLIYEREGVWVLQNLRAQPRAWLVSEAVSVDGEEALRRIRGEQGEDAPFDPERTALIEDAPSELPRLAGGALASDSFARIVEYEPTRLVIETNADRDALLVVSEMFYPGWQATVDGRGERIRLTDYLLRGVAVPAGRHRIEMRYVAPQARNGAIISALTLLALACLCVHALRTRGRGIGAQVDGAKAQSG